MKKLFWGLVSVVAIIGIVSSGSHHNPSTVQLNSTSSSSRTIQQEPVSRSSAPATTVPTPTSTAPTNTSTSDTNLSNDNTYNNVDSSTVHSPAYSTNGSVPVGATAKCYDGTYSFSQHHSGTCSHHGGVAEWL